VVSVGELTRALSAGILPDKIVFSGVGKRDDEIDAALRAAIGSINVESEHEIEQVIARARVLGVRAKISLRVNPAVDPRTHPYLATGLRESKFGIEADRAEAMAVEILDRPELQLVGLAAHIGSQLSDPSPYVEAAGQLRGLVDRLSARGVRLDHLDLGGGMAVAYRPQDPELDISRLGAAVCGVFDDLDLELVLEPGRWLVAEAGLLLTTTLGVKNNGAKEFVIVDAGMNDLLRPSLYQAYHSIVPLRPRGGPIRSVDVVGPVCESGDFLAQGRSLEVPELGSRLAVLAAGAYGACMASSYNTRALPAEVVVLGDKWRVSRPRRSIEELISDELVPDWGDRQ
jgi:diaminopimelate decarboxylase